MIPKKNEQFLLKHWSQLVSSSIFRQVIMLGWKYVGIREPEKRQIYISTVYIRYLHTANIPKEIFINCLFISQSPLSFFPFALFALLQISLHVTILGNKNRYQLVCQVFKKCDILPHTVEITLLVCLCCILFWLADESPRSLIPTHC